MKELNRKTSCFTKTMAAAALCAIFSTNVFAATYQDTPAWASGAVSRIADMGVMVGDSTGKYNPNLILDRFYATKALAKLIGYKSAGYTSDQKTYQDNAYEANKGTLAAFKQKFKKWDASADYEIAYLLEKQVLTMEDLNKYVTMNSNVETLRGLSREDACLYIARAFGMQSEALSMLPSTYQKFADDAQIATFNKPYVYFMRANGIVNPDANDKFNPNTNVTKAVYAVLLDSANTKFGSLTAGTTTKTQLESISAKILEVYPSRGALQIEDYTGKKSIHNVAAGTSITVDGFVKTFSDLAAGMNITAVAVNDELTSIKAVAGQSPATSVSVPGASASATSSTSIPAVTSTIEGTVSKAEITSVNRTISIDVRMLNSVGTIYNETRVFALTNDCAITRGGQTIIFGDIKVGDLVSASVSGNTVYALDARQAEMNFTGTLIEKRKNALTNVNYYVIKDEKSKELELIVTDETVIERETNVTGVRWGDLRAGDTVSVRTNYNTITYISAKGHRNNVEGYVKEIHILENEMATILFYNTVTSELKSYALDTAVVDIYNIRVGDKLRLRLDSWEIDSYTKLENSVTQNVTGKISSLKASSMVLTRLDTNATMQISFDANTHIYDTVGRVNASISALGQNMQVYVTYNPGTTNHASTITILAK